jgi:hypothetical protein
MKRTWFALLAACWLASATGCLHPQTCSPDGACADGKCRGLLGNLFTFHNPGHDLYAVRGWRHHPQEKGPAGPPTGAYAYPYYTLHGPRDFLANDPPSLGR